MIPVPAYFGLRVLQASKNGRTKFGRLFRSLSTSVNWQDCYHDSEHAYLLRAEFRMCWAMPSNLEVTFQLPTLASDLVSIDKR